MRKTLLAAMAALTWACSPPAEQAPSATTEAAATTAASTPPPELEGPLAEGAWTFEEGNIASSAGFGLPDAADSQFVVACERGPKLVSLILQHELSPDQDTTLTIRTAADTLNFPARSSNSGLRTVVANVTAPDPQLASLAGAEGRFAVIAGESRVLLPMDETVKRVLALCGQTPG